MGNKDEKWRQSPQEDVAEEDMTWERDENTIKDKDQCQAKPMTFFGNSENL
jgi:hypothetical protein